ncbi:MAG: hypothetical protein ACREHD_14930 [Pirellulales bacterium]
MHRLLVFLSPCLLVFFLASAVEAKPAVTKTKGKAVRLPTFEAMKAAVSQHFKSTEHYQPGDVLSRGKVEPVLARLAKLGWNVSDRGDILKQLLADDDEMVRALRAPAHREFMQHVGQMPGGYGYDRLDRLARMEDGKIIVNRLMEEPGGWNLIRIMTETTEAPGMAQAFSMGPGGKDFAKPTGRIYTEAQLIARLKQSYDNAAKTQP